MEVEAIAAAADWSWIHALSTIASTAVGAAVVLIPLGWRIVVAINKISTTIELHDMRLQGLEIVSRDMARVKERVQRLEILNKVQHDDAS